MDAEMLECVRCGDELPAADATPRLDPWGGVRGHYCPTCRDREPSDADLDLSGERAAAAREALRRECAEAGR